MTKNFIKNNAGELLGTWAHEGHHVVATAFTLVDGLVTPVTKNFTSKSGVMNRSQAGRWILQTAAA
jgi:hypothetical protein